MILTTERLILRPWKESDAESLYEYARDPEIGPPAGWPPHKSIEESLNVIKNVFPGRACYAICEAGNDKAIGAAELKLNGHTDMTERDDECELGYWLGKPFWGRGYMPEAARELIRHGFTELGMTTIWCGYYEGNTKSKRVQEKLGFSYHHTCNDVPVPLMNEIRIGHTNVLTKESWIESFTIRPLSENEIPAALGLAWKVFSEYESPDYPPEGTEEFRRCLHDEGYLSGITYYGAFDGGKLIGTVAIRRETFHICFFFVDGKYHRLGLGTKLFKRMAGDFRGKAITLNSSPFGLPFYRSLGFVPTDREQTVNGIRFTPMIFDAADRTLRIIRLSERRDLVNKAADWFSGKWSVPKKAYLESIEDSFTKTVPSWYLCLDGEKIAAGAGVIENDFHERKDLAPNVCAVYTEPEYRSRGIAGKLLDFISEDMASHGVDPLYLLTDHTGFYERYGWEFLCMVAGDGEDVPSRMYVHYRKRPESRE